ncbi:MAG: hypothetical protein ACI4KJ_05755 [Anaerovoracaceae bacterium]
MKQLHVKALNLLKEIDRICLDNGIRYYIGPKTTLLLERFGTIGDEYKLDVLMPAEDIEAFVSAAEAESPDGYELESMLTNENYLGFTLRYTDANTTVLSFKNGTNISCLGVAVTILPMRKKQNGNRIRTVNFIERGWESNGFNLTKNTAKKHQAGARLVNMITRLGGRENMAERLFHLLVRENSGAMGSKKISVRRPKTHEVVLSGKHFRKAERVELDGICVNAPVSRTKLLEDWFGVLWATMPLTPSGDSVLLDNVPYREFIAECERRGVDMDELFKVKRENRVESIRAQSLIDKKMEAINIAKRSGERLRLYEILKPRMKEIERAFEDKDYDSLRIILGENELVTQEYLKYNLGFAVNELCMRAQAELFRQSGREDLADRLIKLVPVEHYKSIIE